jgi:hypothetical protein
VIVQKTAAACLASCLADDMADFMAEERLTAEACKVQHARRKGDIRAAGDGSGSCVGDRLALIELHGGKIRSERVLHLFAHGSWQIDPAAHLCPRRLYGTGTQCVQRRLLRGCLRMLRSVFRPFAVVVHITHADLMPFERMSLMPMEDPGLAKDCRSVSRVDGDLCVTMGIGIVVSVGKPFRDRFDAGGYGRDKE